MPLNTNKSVNGRFGRYPGSKWRIIPTLLEYVTRQHDLFLDVYGGFGSMILRKERSAMEVYNDLNADFDNLFTVLNYQRDDFALALKFTPWSTRYFERVHSRRSLDPVLRAVEFFFICEASLFSPFEYPNHFRRQIVLSKKPDGKQSMTPASQVFYKVLDRLDAIADRMHGVHIECEPALDCLVRYDNPKTFHFVDPPYWKRRSGKRAFYLHEMLDKQSHIDLADTVNGLSGMVMVCGYADPLYTELYENRGWVRVDIGGVRTNSADSPATESLWLNENAFEYLIDDYLSLIDQTCQPPIDGDEVQLSLFSVDKGALS